MAQDAKSKKLLYLLKNPIHLLSLGFGAGLVAKMPGTAGTLVAIPLYLLCQDLPLMIYALLVVAGFAMGCWLCAQTAKVLADNDPGPVVWDEIIGYFVTMTAAPSGWLWILLGFALFRFFDIVKPWPIKSAERVAGVGLAIMLDDVLAGLMAAFCLQLLAQISFAFSV